MDSWKTYITTANHYFAHSKFNQAQSVYESALEEAHRLFPIWDDPHEAVSALIVTYHNIADLHQKQGQTRAARELFERIHKLILRAVSSTPIDDKRHGALYRGSIETYKALITHKRCHLLEILH